MNKAGYAIVTELRRGDIDPYEVRDIGLRGLARLAAESVDERVRAQCLTVLATLGVSEVKRREELAAKQPLDVDDDEFAAPAPPQLGPVASDDPEE
jgi:hypothetical protein